MSGDDLQLEALYDAVPSTPRPVSQEKSLESLYDVVPCNPIPMMRENSRAESMDLQCSSAEIEVSETNLKNREGADRPDNNGSFKKNDKRSSRIIKKADSVRELSRKSEKETVKRERSSSFSKRAFVKLRKNSKKDQISKENDDDENYIMIDKAHGTLFLKKKKLLSTWHKYFFVMDGSQLTYFSNVEQYRRLTPCIGSIDLTLLESVTKKKPKGFFKTYYPLLLGRRSLTPLYLGALTEHEQEKWLELLNKALDTRKAASERIKRASMMIQDLQKDTSPCTASPDSEKSFSKREYLSHSFKRKSSQKSTKSDDCEDMHSDENRRTSLNDLNGNDIIEVGECELSKNEMSNVIKRVKGRNIGIPTSDILSVKLKKTYVNQEKEDSLNNTDTDAPANFGVKLKKVHSCKEARNADENSEFDFRNILKSSRTLPRNVNKDQRDYSTLKAETPRSSRSPSPNLPLSKSLKSVLEKSTVEHELVMEQHKSQCDTFNEIAIKSEISSEFHSYESTKLCPVLHAISENIRYSDPPTDLKITESQLEACHSILISEDPDSTIGEGKRVIARDGYYPSNFPHNDLDEIETTIKVSALQNIILLPKSQEISDTFEIKSNTLDCISISKVDSVTTTPTSTGNIDNISKASIETNQKHHGFDIKTNTKENRHLIADSLDENHTKDVCPPDESPVLSINTPSSNQCREQVLTDNLNESTTSNFSKNPVFHFEESNIEKKRHSPNTFGVANLTSLSIGRSESVESGEPLTRTSFMGGRRSWSSISNCDGKISTNSDSSASKESVEIPLRKNGRVKTNIDMISSARYRKNNKRNSSGCAESIGNSELSFVKKVRPISNPISCNRESLILPEFIVVEEVGAVEQFIEKNTQS